MSSVSKNNNNDIEMLSGAGETTPLISSTGGDSSSQNQTVVIIKTRREHIYDFLEAKTSGGKIYEMFIIILIVINVIAFIIGTLFVEEYNTADWAQRDGDGGGICNNLCDAIWFGNYKDNGLQILNIGSTSVLEIFTVVIFTIEYIFRLYVADFENPSRYKGFVGRIRYLPSFYSIVDLVSTVPFYIDSFLLRKTDLFASQFLRMFRLFRMMRVEGRYDTAITMFDDVIYEQKDILGTAAFVGVTTWMTVSSLYYLVERKSLDMIYCGAAPDYCGGDDDIDTSLCSIDYWGIVDCTNAGCPPSDEYPEPCYNLYRSIPMSSYYSLLNLFGEFPLIDQHNTAGKIVGTLVAVIAVAVFALPAGIIGNGFEELIDRKRRKDLNNAKEEISQQEQDDNDDEALTDGFVGDTNTIRGSLYNFLFALTSYGSNTFDNFINILVLGTALTFMLDTLGDTGVSSIHILFNIFELTSVCIFTVEYVLRVYSSKEDPKYKSLSYGRIKFMGTFLPIVDVLSVAPYWLMVIFSPGGYSVIITSTSDSSSTISNLVKSLRLFRLLRFEKYTHAFRSFDDVIRNSLDILTVTCFSAILLWVFFGAMLYFTERDNPDDEMSAAYNNVPNAMWVTLLNLSGESPLAQYSAWGKIITGFLGLVATGIFGIPIGVLGAGFEEVIEDEDDDEEEEEGDDGHVVVIDAADSSSSLGTSFERMCNKFVNDNAVIELSIYALILISVAVSILQTVDGHENDLHSVEWFVVTIFTIEYVIRFIGAPADPQFGSGSSNGFVLSRIRYVLSFYSIIDLLAILPFYLAIALPNSIIDEYDEYLRMFRLLRLIKLDKYIPSISLIDDVVRLKRKGLTVAGYAAGTLWILFAGLLYVTERNDTTNEIDNVPLYGCDTDCTMSDRFQNFFDSMVYTGVHLTGDYPIITYTWPARFLNFFMVIAAVGVVSIPSGLLASGFADICQSKVQNRKGKKPKGRAGDDWYEIRLKELEDVPPPPSRFGPLVDKWQVAVNELLNGKEDENGVTTWTTFSYSSRVFIFTVIILNIFAVIIESVPEIDRAVGNESGNFFDQFEMFSVMVFALEYILRLFCAPKNREALYSSVIYATTFFGIVDFLSTAPWFIQQILIVSGTLDANGDSAKIFRIFRIFRILQLEDFVVAFSKLDNVFRASKDVLKATGLMAFIIWVGCSALFYLFEENNPNFRSCDASIPLQSDDPDMPGCYDFSSTRACNEFYPGMCDQKAFTNVPNSLYFVAVFLVGEWGIIDFTWPGRIVALFLCVAGIGLYAIPTGTLFDSFGAVLGMGDDEEEEDEEENKKE